MWGAGTLIGCLPNNFLAVNAGSKLGELKAFTDLYDAKIILVGERVFNMTLPDAGPYGECISKCTLHFSEQLLATVHCQRLHNFACMQSRNSTGCHAMMICSQQLLHS